MGGESESSWWTGSLKNYRAVFLRKDKITPCISELPFHSKIDEEEIFLCFKDMDAVFIPRFDFFGKVFGAWSSRNGLCSCLRVI